MMLFLYVVIIFYLLFIRKKEKNAWIIAACTIAILSITSLDYADLNNYGPLFNYYNSGDVNLTFSINNFVWALLCKVFYFIGFNYRGMVICLVFINYYMLHKAAQNIKCDENKFFGLFLIFPSLIQLVQIKFFTAYVIVALGISFLLLNRKKSMLMYILMVLFASLIHSSVTLFLILLLVKSDKINPKIIFIISALMVVIIGLNINAIGNISKYLISYQQYDRYIVNTITPSSILWIIMILASWVICYFFATSVNKKPMENYENSIDIVLKRGVISINMLLLTLPLLLLDRNMHRFLELGFAILFFMITCVLKNKKMNKHNYEFIICLCVFLTIVMFIYTPYNTVLDPLLSYEGIVNIWR